MSHTPGPWKWFDYPDGRKLLAGPNRAVIHCPDAPITVEPSDQVLIAAAPELYAALRNHLPYIEDMLAPCEEGCTCPLHDFRAALAKTEGR